jgi:hypothetical protein
LLVDHTWRWPISKAETCSVNGVIKSETKTRVAYGGTWTLVLLICCIQISSGTHPVSYTVGTTGCLPSSNADSWSLSSIKDKNGGTSSWHCAIKHMRMSSKNMDMDQDVYRYPSLY